ncbi:MAG: hypothetical protein ACJ8J0_29030 [Longimicrobiaceae bacterium]
MKKTMALLALAALALGACDSHRGMVVRTYPLHRLGTDEAVTLLTPYVGEGGYLTGRSRFVTVRERPAQLDSIAAVLRRYDGAPQTVTLHFQVIEAGDFAGGDSAIARVVGPLRELLRYRGYRLVGEMTVVALEGGHFLQSQPGLRIDGMVREATLAGPDARVTLDLEVTGDDGSVATSVSGLPGKTLVVGSQKKRGGGAIIAAVTPEVARP